MTCSECGKFIVLCAVCGHAGCPKTSSHGYGGGLPLCKKCHLKGIAEYIRQPEMGSSQDRPWPDS